MGVIRIIPPAEGAAPGADALGLTHRIDASLEDRGHRDRTLPPDHAWVCFSVAPGLARQGQLLCSVQAGARPDQGDACQAVHNRVLVQASAALRDDLAVQGQCIDPFFTLFGCNSPGTGYASP